MVEFINRGKEMTGCTARYAHFHLGVARAMETEGLLREGKGFDFS